MFIRDKMREYFKGGGSEFMGLSICGSMLYGIKRGF
jgi:hypothetical protein